MARFWQRTTNSADQLVNRRLLQVGYLAAGHSVGCRADRAPIVAVFGDGHGRSARVARSLAVEGSADDRVGSGLPLAELAGQPDGADAVPDRAVVAMLDLVGRMTEDSHRAVAFDEVQAQWLRGYSQFGVPEPAPFTPDVIAGRSGTSGTSSVVADGPVPSSSDDVELASSLMPVSVIEASGTATAADAQVGVEA